ncbi:MAG: hypothetical protein ABFC34_13960 [Methanobacterium sp.]
MKKKILIFVIAIFAITGIVFAINGTTFLSLNKTRATVAVKYDTTATYNAKYSDYINYTLYTENQDSCIYYVLTYGKINTLAKWVLVKRDTLTIANTAAVKYKNVTLRNLSTDYLAGFNEYRILIHSPAIEADDSLGTMKYYLQISYRNNNK